MKKGRNIDVKPCPFCGGEELLLQQRRFFWIECGKCGAQTTQTQSQRRAVVLWNNRAQTTGKAKLIPTKSIEDKLLAENNRLREATRWRKVRDEPPQTGQLILYKGQDVLGNWFTGLHKVCDDRPTPTYWWYLPVPPLRVGEDK